jgi:hypothetical protein
VLQLVATGLSIINSKLFMLDGTAPHIANIILNFFRDTFGLCVISGQFLDCHACGYVWPLIGLDINNNPCVFFFGDS